MSDNAYVIGYRIDVKIPDDMNPFDNFEDGAEEAGITIDSLPNNGWMWWNVGNGIVSVYFLQQDHKLAVDYRCPISRDELWEDMHNEPFDVPDTYAEDIEAMKSTDAFKWLVKKYKKENVKVKWGLALMLD